MYKTVKDLVSYALEELGQPDPTEAEYKATCTLLRKYDWDLVDSFTDPDSTLQTGGMAGALVGVFKELALIQEERGVAVYSLAHFCEDVIGTPQPTKSAISPAPANTPPPTTPATFQPGQREYMYENVYEDIKEIVSDMFADLGQPAPTEADYRATCTLLRKHDWDLGDSMTDPDYTLQTGGIAGALVGGFKELTRVREEHGLTVYSLAHFCEDVLEE